MSDEDPCDAPAENINESSEDVSVPSAATASAGKELLQEQKLSGTYRKHQLRCDLRLFVPPLQEADKTMIAMAKKFFIKAKRWTIAPLSLCRH